MSIEVKPSPVLRDLINSWVDGFMTNADIADKIATQGAEDGLSTEQIRDLIVAALKEKGLSKATIYRQLPNEFKNKEKQHFSTNKQPPSNPPPTRSHDETKNLPPPAQDNNDDSSSNYLPNTDNSSSSHNESDSSQSKQSAQTFYKRINFDLHQMIEKCTNLLELGARKGVFIFDGDKMDIKGTR